MYKKHKSHSSTFLRIYFGRSVITDLSHIQNPAMQSWLRQKALICKNKAADRNTTWYSGADNKQTQRADSQR